MNQLYIHIYPLPVETPSHLPLSHPSLNFCLSDHRSADFPGSSTHTESTCNAGDSGSIPGLVRSSGEGIGYLLQYSWASLVAQMAKNPPAVWETWVRSLGWEDPLEGGIATHSRIPAWRIPGGLQSMGVGSWKFKDLEATKHINKCLKNPGSQISLEVRDFFCNVDNGPNFSVL